MATIAEQPIEKGKKKGIEEGLRGTLVRRLQRRFVSGRRRGAGGEKGG